MAYVDGYVIPVPRTKLAIYRRIAQKAGKVWREYGALEYRECVGDDLQTKMGAPFPRSFKLRDPRIATLMKKEPMPFDVKRMVYGGFKVMVNA
jgi:uncharacterized protein YbaA (DUF1428 family)